LDHAQVEAYVVALLEEMVAADANKLHQTESS
jgi:hypothetical protein